MYYLAYGSNLHPLRLALRAPKSNLVGTVQLEGYRLTFHKRSSDGSSKCNLDHTQNPDHTVHAAVYNIPQDEIGLLDVAEGLNKGYFKQQMNITINGDPYLVFVYLASRTHIVANLEPYHWYKGLVLAGARRLQFPTEYLQFIEAITSKHDDDDNRRFEMENLLVQLND